MKAMVRKYESLNMTPVIDAQYLITLKFADSLADHLTNDQIARALQAPSDDCNAAWGTKLQAVWKKEFAPATVGRRKARVDETNQIDFGVAHLHLWMAQPPTGPSRYGRRSPYREEFGGWPWHKWLEKAWRRIIRLVVKSRKRGHQIPQGHHMEWDIYPALLLYTPKEARQYSELPTYYLENGFPNPDQFVTDHVLRPGFERFPDEETAARHRC